MERGELLDFAVIRNDEGNLADQFAGAPAVQQVGHAMQILRAEEGDARPARARGQLPVHAELGGKGREGGFESVEVEAVERPLHAHEEQAEVVVDVLVGVQDIGAALVEKPRHARHKAFAIGAVDQKNSGIFHLQSRLRYRISRNIQAKVRDQVGAHDVAERVLQLHRLDEEIVLRVEARWPSAAT